MFGSTVDVDSLRDDTADPPGINAPVHMDAQALTGIFVDNIEHAKLAAAHRAVVNEVPCPDMAPVCCFDRKARRYALTALLRLLGRHGQSEFTPQALHHTSADSPAFIFEQLRHFGIAQLGMLIGDAAQSRLKLGQLCIGLFGFVGEGAAV